MGLSKLPVWPRVGAFVLPEIGTATASTAHILSTVKSFYQFSLPSPPVVVNTVVGIRTRNCTTSDLNFGPANVIASIKSHSKAELIIDLLPSPNNPKTRLHEYLS
jgi:hypothetical protein